eukprot:gene10730-19510_t
MAVYLEADKQDMKEMAGYALYFYGYSTWKGRLLYLEDMYVQPKYRGIGIGTGFFKRIGQPKPDLSTQCIS